ncbi:hypothetical protein [Nocardioides speluncae]|uniref:hypothetical protein n=1 Tax=Nocardioides speluncae TaxID=2670337 RepID=UPI000D6893D3|nr:hypothetical protein [Nocardioides speluncae]
MSAPAKPARSDVERFLDHLDYLEKVINAAAVQVRPAYAETCSCGGTVEISREIPATERRRMYREFYGRHLRCTTREVTQ